MATKYTYSLSGDFTSGLNSAQFHQEIVNDTTITTTLDGVNTQNDIVDVVFDSALSVPIETDQLDALVVAHVPETPNIVPDFYIEPNTSVVKFDHDSTTYKILFREIMCSMSVNENNQFLIFFYYTQFYYPIIQK